MLFRGLGALALSVLISGSALAQTTFPGATWATRTPADARRHAQRDPAGPAPIIATSNCSTGDTLR